MDGWSRIRIRGGGTCIFRVPNSLDDTMVATRGGDYYIGIKAWVVQWKDKRHWQPRSTFRVRRSSVGLEVAH
jgi:hypothetical protein